MRLPRGIAFLLGGPLSGTESGDFQGLEDQLGTGHLYGVSTSELSRSTPLLVGLGIFISTGKI